jgi:hypothetical protein
VERFGDLMDKETRDEKRLKARLTKWETTITGFKQYKVGPILNLSLFELFPHLMFNISYLEFVVPVLNYLHSKIFLSLVFKSIAHQRNLKQGFRSTQNNNNSNNNNNNKIGSVSYPTALQVSTLQSNIISCSHISFKHRNRLFEIGKSQNLKCYVRKFLC